ncbi:MAG: hypothetical protein ACR2LS_07395 [Thermomicrobiales bacterium]
MGIIFWLADLTNTVRSERPSGQAVEERDVISAAGATRTLRSFSLFDHVINRWRDPAHAPGRNAASRRFRLPSICSYTRKLVSD